MRLMQSEAPPGELQGDMAELVAALPLNERMETMAALTEMFSEMEVAAVAAAVARSAKQCFARA